LLLLGFDDRWFLPPPPPPLPDSFLRDDRSNFRLHDCSPSSVEHSSQESESESSISQSVGQLSELEFIVPEFGFDEVLVFVLSLLVVPEEIAS
jgi:hypothetical protein